MTTEANVRLKLTGDASQAQKEFSNFSAGTAAKFGVIATAASKAFELVLDAGIKALKGIVIEGAQFETKMKAIWAVTGEGKEVLLSLEKTARDLGKTTVVSATEAADAMLNYARAGFSADQITKMMKGSIELSVATATDLAIVTDTVASAINQFGMNASDTSRIVDVLAMTANKSAVDVTTLQQSLIYAGSVGKAFGLSFEEVNAILGELGNVGHRGSIAGMELSRALVELSTPTDRQAEALGRYNISLEDVNAETHKITDTLELFAKKGVTASDIMVIFGQEAGKGMASLIEGIKSGKVDFAEFIKTLESAKETTNKLSTEMSDTVNVKYKQFTSALSELSLKVYDVISGPLTSLLDTSTQTLNGINTAIEDSNKKNVESTFSTWLYIKNITEKALSFLADLLIQGLYVPIKWIYMRLVDLAQAYFDLMSYMWPSTFGLLKTGLPVIDTFIESQKALGMTTIDLAAANDNLLSSQNEVLASYDEAIDLMTPYRDLTKDEIEADKKSSDSKDHKSNTIKGLSFEYKRLSEAIDSYNVSLVNISSLEFKKPTFGKRPVGAPSADIFGVEKSILPEKTIFPTETFDDRKKKPISFFEDFKTKTANFVIGGFEEGVSILSGKGNLFASLGKGLSSTLNFAFENSIGKLSPLMSKVLSGVTGAAIALPVAIGGDLFSQLMSVGGDSKGRKEKLADVTEQISSLTEKRGISSPEQKAEIDKRIAELELQQKELQKSNADILHDQFELTKQKWLGMFDNLIEFMPMLVDAFGDILQQILLKLPDVVKVLANNIDDIILMIAGSLDEIIVSLASAMPYVALALAKAMPVVAIGLVTAVVEMIDKILGKIGLGGVLDKPVKGLHNLQENTIQALMGDTEKTMGKRHSGGNVFGGDNVPMMLQGGEFVMSRRAVNRIGVNSLEQMNQGHADQNGSNSISITINAIDQKSVSEYMKETFIPEFMNLLNDNNRVNGTTLRRELRFAVTGM